MKSNDLIDIRNLQLIYLQDKDARFNTVHPWRKEWKYSVLHAYRVEKYVETIFSRELQEIPEEDKLLTRIAALVQDIGKQESESNHAVKSGEIVEQFIEEGNISYLTQEQQKRLVYMVSKHSEKRIEQKEIEFCHKGFDLVYTITAKELLEEKMRFIETASNQLKNELMGIYEI